MTGPEHLDWSATDGTASVHFALSALQTIEAAIAEAARHAPIRGAEIGGLLMGNSGPTGVWIDAIELLPSRYPNGPSFHLDSQDMPDFTRDGIAGYFRSHTRKDVFLSDYDRELIAERFTNPGQIFLIVKPFKTRPNVGAIFLRMEQGLDASTPTGEFTFPAPVNPSANPEMDRAAAEIAAMGRSGKAPLLLWAALLFLGLTGVGGLAYLVLHKTQPVPAQAAHPVAAPPALSAGLTASEGEREISVKWNRQSAAVQSATRAVVEIREGTFEKSITLDAGQLRNGSLVYSRPAAIADTLSFSLRLFFDREKPLVERVELVSNRAVAPQPAPQPALQPTPQPRPIAKAPPPRLKTPTAEPPPDTPAAPVLMRPAPRRIP